MRWTEIDVNQADAPTARFGHVAVVIDARDEWGTELVIVHGGLARLQNDQETFLSDVCIFQAVQEAWVKPQISSVFTPGPRAFHSATDVDKDFLFFGGQAFIPNTSPKTTFNDVWMLSVVSENDWSWRKCGTQSPQQPQPRSLSSMAHIGDGRVIVFGGRNEASKALDDLWIFHTEEDCWECFGSIAESPPPRLKHSMTFADGVLWLFGGEMTNGTIYDDLWMLAELKETKQWQWKFIRTKPKPVGRSGHCLVAVSDQKLLCFGGHLGNSVYTIFSQSLAFTNEVWLYDIKTNIWSKLEPETGNVSPIERVCLAAVAVCFGNVFVFSGKGKSKILRDTWRLELGSTDLSAALPQRSMSQLSLPVFPHSGTGGTASQSRDSSSQNAETGEEKRTVTNYAAPLLVNMWSNLPSISSKNLFSRMTPRQTTTEKPTALAHGGLPLRDAPVTELSVLDDGNGNGYRKEIWVFEFVMAAAEGEDVETVDDGLSVLCQYFDIDKDSGTEGLLLPEDDQIDAALVSYAQALPHSTLAAADHHRKRESILAKAREILTRTDPRELKLGDLWMLLADYKRLLLNVDLAKIRTRDRSSTRPSLSTRFLHCSVEALRFSDLPELLLNYRNLIELLS